MYLNPSNEEREIRSQRSKYSTPLSWKVYQHSWSTQLRTLHKFSRDSWFIHSRRSVENCSGWKGRKSGSPRSVLIRTPSVNLRITTGPLSERTLFFNPRLPSLIDGQPDRRRSQTSFSPRKPELRVSCTIREDGVKEESSFHGVLRSVSLIRFFGISTLCRQRSSFNNLHWSRDGLS